MMVTKAKQAGGYFSAPLMVLFLGLNSCFCGDKPFCTKADNIQEIKLLNFAIEDIDSIAIETRLKVISSTDKNKLIKN